MEFKKDKPADGHKNESESKIERLANELEQTNAILRKNFSLRMTIIRGLLTGLAVVVGSTLIASILFSGAQSIFGDIKYLDEQPTYSDPRNQ